MTHTEARELLVDLACGALPAVADAEVREHVAGCPECGPELDELEAARRMAAPLSEPEEPGPGFDAPIIAAARAEASLRSDGTPGAVVETTASVSAAHVEPAMIDVDPRASVRPAPRAQPSRRSRRWAIGASVAAAAVLAVVVSSSLRHEQQPATESQNSDAYQIHIKAPAQPAPVDAQAARAPAAKEAPPAAPAQSTTSPAPPAAAAAAEPPRAREAKPVEEATIARTPPPAVADASRAAPSAPAAPPPPAPMPAASLRALGLSTGGAAKSVAAADARSGAASAPSGASGAGPGAGANAATRASGAAAAPAAGAASGDASPEALEEAARASRREGNYALAAARYRKAAQLRQAGAGSGAAADASAPAWDLAHATECLAAISEWTSARAVRRELEQLYPGETAAAAAAARALRPAELAPQDSSATPADPQR